MKVAYIRVSTEEQNTARQEEAMKTLGVEKFFIEKASGKNTDRPQLKAMLDFIKTGDTVVVESYSRLARNTRDFLRIVKDITKNGIIFVSLKESIDTSTPQGKFMLTVFAGLVQYERENLLQMQSEGIAIAKAEGKYKGRKPIEKPDNFNDVMALWNENKITARRAMELLGIKKDTFYRWVRNDIKK